MIATVFSLLVASSVFADPAPKTVAEAINQTKANSEDLNHNNIRDDVTAYIASLPDTAPQKRH